MSCFHGNSEYANAPKYFRLKTSPFLGFILYLCIKLDIKQNTAARGSGFYKATNSLKMYNNLPEITSVKFCTDSLYSFTYDVCVCVCVCVYVVHV